MIITEFKDSPLYNIAQKKAFVKRQCGTHPTWHGACSPPRAKSLKIKGLKNPHPRGHLHYERVRIMFIAYLPKADFTCFNVSLNNLVSIPKRGSLGF